MTNFAKQLQTHLAGYKQERLRITEDGIWARNGKAYPHVLPATDKECNILEPIRTAFWGYAGKNRLRSQLHSDFHHLSSSQALTFNLFFTFFGLPWSEHAVLLEALGMPDQPVASFEFESVPDQKEATSFDFCATFTNGTRLLVEVKLSESDFGKCANDEKHQIKRDTLYRPRLVGKVQSSAVDSGMFFTQYQLLRNVSHLREGDVLVFLLPRANRSAFAHAERFVKDVVTDATRPAIHVVALEDLLDLMSSAPINPQTTEMISMLREKYIVESAAYRARRLMNHFVVYHNPVTMGYDARTIDGYKIVTTKSVMGAVGSRVWLITGRGSPKSYSLVLSFIAEKVGRIPEDPRIKMVSADHGTKYRPEIELNSLSWFPDFRITMGNFGLGFQRISSPEFIRSLEALDINSQNAGNGDALLNDMFAGEHLSKGTRRRRKAP